VSSAALALRAAAGEAEEIARVKVSGASRRSAFRIELAGRLRHFEAIYSYSA
jgi:hypothetical protein